eukprot:3933107-Rhodomonas_salina.1
MFGHYARPSATRWPDLAVRELVGLHPERLCLCALALLHRRRHQHLHPALLRRHGHQHLPCLLLAHLLRLLPRVLLPRVLLLVVVSRLGLALRGLLVAGLLLLLLGERALLPPHRPPVQLHLHLRRLLLRALRLRHLQHAPDAQLSPQRGLGRARRGGVGRVLGRVDVEERPVAPRERLVVRRDRAH